MFTALRYLISFSCLGILGRYGIWALRLPGRSCHERSPRTTTTVSWVTGAVGFAYVTVPDGTLSAEAMNRLNQEYEGVLAIESSGSDSHMWHGQTTVKFLEHMSTELRKRRAEIGCFDCSARAMLICDRCPSHLSRTYLDLRRNWAREQNVLLVGCDPDADAQVPGGWGLSSSPNDGWHGHFHTLRMAYLRCAMKLPLNPLYAADLREMNAAGYPTLSCPVSLSLRADAWALTEVAKFGSGKTILWAWMSRGYLSAEVAAEWHFEGQRGPKSRCLGIYLVFRTEMSVCCVGRRYESEQAL